MAKVLIVYDSLRGTTKKIAETLEKQLAAAGHQVTVNKGGKVTAAELEGADLLLFGGPTYHKDLIGTMKQFLFRAAEAELADKPGAAFSSYGWSGESLGILEDTMKNQFRMQLVAPGLAVKQTPSLAKIKAAVEPFAQEITGKL
ncbi:MAG: flavodoxin family protein [Deltaproteobacteria bacterium]|nr:flavodoxin family protein [Deltaproteobacteria bacterium]